MGLCCGDAADDRPAAYTHLIKFVNTQFTDILPQYSALVYE